MFRPPSAAAETDRSTPGANLLIFTDIIGVEFRLPPEFNIQISDSLSTTLIKNYELSEELVSSKDIYQNNNVTSLL